MDSAKPEWLSALETGGKLVDIDLSHVRTGAGASGVIPLLSWDHMQALLVVLEANLATIQVLNVNGLRMGDVGLGSLVDRVLTKEGCSIHTVDMRNNALTSSGLRHAILKLSAFNYSICDWLLEENVGNVDTPISVSLVSSSSSSSSNGSSSSYSDSFPSSKRSAASGSSRPGPSPALLAAKRDKEDSFDSSSSSSSSSAFSSYASSSNGGVREILSMSFQELIDKYVSEFLKLNRDASAVIRGQASLLHLRYLPKHPRLCPVRMAKLVGQLGNVTSLTLEGWTPPPPLALKAQEKKLSKLSADQVALKELKRSVPGTMFASLPKLTELKLVKCVRVDVEKSKKGTLRGVLGGMLMGRSSNTALKSSFCPSIPLEVGAMPCLRRLTMSECGLEEITPNVLTYMTHIEQIDFSVNDISSIPPQISSLANVTRLILNSNNITEIPNEISSMRYLRELWLYDNLITKVPSDLAKWFPVLKDLRILTQRVEDSSLVMDDPELLELRKQEEDLIRTKSTIGCIGFFGMLKLSQATDIVLYKPPAGKKKK